jgi:hypothetical protein
LGIFKIQRASRADLSLAFVAIAFPLHVWAIINILDFLPAWLLRLSAWELTGVISYALVDALLESCVLWAVLVILSFILPRKWLADKFVALSCVLVWVLAAWAALVQFIFVSILQWGPAQLVPGLLLVLFSFGLVYWLVQRYGKFAGWIKQLAQGLVILTYFYMVFDLLGLVIVILRNL